MIYSCLHSHQILQNHPSNFDRSHPDCHNSNHWSCCRRLENRDCDSSLRLYASHFAEPGDEDYAPPVQKAETPMQRRARIHKLRLEKGAQKAVEELEKFDPHKDPNATEDPYKTLFVARLSYETTEHGIKREFEAYSPIKRVRLIMDKETNNKPIDTVSGRLGR